MSWTGSVYKGMFHPFSRGRVGGRMLRGVIRRAGRMRRPSAPRPRRGCCCCPLVFVLGLAGLGLLGGSVYAGIRLLGWA
jgi:hypothetical protein